MLQLWYQFLWAAICRTFTLSVTTFVLKWSITVIVFASVVPAGWYNAHSIVWGHKENTRDYVSSHPCLHMYRFDEASHFWFPFLCFILIMWAEQGNVAWHNPIGIDFNRDNVPTCLITVSHSFKNDKRSLNKCAKGSRVKLFNMIITGTQSHCCKIVTCKHFNQHKLHSKKNLKA